MRNARFENLEIFAVFCRDFSFFLFLVDYEISLKFTEVVWKNHNFSCCVSRIREKNLDFYTSKTNIQHINVHNFVFLMLAPPETYPPEFLQLDNFR